MPLIENPSSPLVEQLQGVHLFHFDGAPCAQRVRFALAEKGLTRGREVKFDAADARSCAGETDRWVSRIVSLVKRDHLTETYAKIHPNMVVPALVHDGRLYLESMDIIEYLDKIFGGDPLIPHEKTLQAEAYALANEAKELHLSIRFVTFHWGLGRLAMLNRKAQTQLKQLAAQGPDGENLATFYDGFSNGTIPEEIYMEHLSKLFRAFSHQDKVLHDGRPFLTGQTLTIADIFWAMKVLRLLECGYPIEIHHPAFYEWYQRMYKRTAFQEGVMGKNRLTNRLFRAKARLENTFGIGLNNAVAQVAHA